MTYVSQENTKETPLELKGFLFGGSDWTFGSLVLSGK